MHQNKYEIHVQDVTQSRREGCDRGVQAMLLLVTTVTGVFCFNFLSRLM